MGNILENEIQEKDQYEEDEKEKEGVALSDLDQNLGDTWRISGEGT